MQDEGHIFWKFQDTPGERERTGQINMQKAGSKIYAKLNNELATHYK